jgi:hypothetical protein
VDTKVIALSKGKILRLVGGAIAFIAVSLWLAYMDPSNPSDAWYWHQHNPYFVHAVGIVGAAVFGACAIWWVTKLFDTRPGLILERDGFTDYSGALPSGFVPWSDVTGLSVFKVKSTRTLVVKVADPEQYIKRGNALRRTLARVNANTCGSPIRIGSNDLTIGFDELSSLFDSYWRAWKDARSTRASTGSV